MFSAPIVLFDFDGTFTCRDTLMPFLKHCVGPAMFYRKIIEQSLNLVAYFVGLVPNNVAKERLLCSFFRGWGQTKFEEVGRAFADQELPGLVQAQMLTIFRWHQAQGHRCYLVSASLDVYLGPWSSRHGFDGTICTRLESTFDGVLTGRIQGANVYGEEKASRVRAFFQHNTPEITYAYGDSQGDSQMLAMAKHPWLKGHFLGETPENWMN